MRSRVQGVGGRGYGEGDTSGVDVRLFTSPQKMPRSRICMYIYIYIYISIYLSIYLSIYIYIYIYIFIYIYIHMYMYICIYIYMCA